MKTFVYYLTADQLPAIAPQVLDGWLYSDPIYGPNFTYPATAFGGEGAPYDLSRTFSVTADDEMFFPWGYQIQNQIQTIIIPNLKGDTNLTFVASGIDTSQHDILKIIYEPDNGDDTVIFSRSIIPVTVYTVVSDLVSNVEIDSPSLKTATFLYRASSEPITYSPSVTAFFSDTTIIFFNFTVVVYPNSVYDLENVKLIDISPASQLSSSYVKVYEIADSQIILGVDKVI